MIKWNLLFFLNSILLGAGLAMDAFSVSLVNGLKEPQMKKTKFCLIAGTFAFFQFLMPMVGWICVHTIITFFQAFKTAIPWIALILLLYIGGKMLLEGLKSGNEDSTQQPPVLTFATLMVQGIATSIDALSVGFTIADYNWLEALISSIIIAAVTFIICAAGLVIGKKAGTKIAGKSNILGGVILILIGIEIFVKGLFG